MRNTVRNGISLSERAIIQNFKKSCLAEMSSHGLESSDQIIASQDLEKMWLYNFLVKDDQNKPSGWYMAGEGVSKGGNPYLVCLYGAILADEIHEFQSYNGYDFTSIQIVTALRKKIRTYVDKSIIDYKNELKNKYFVDKNWPSQIKPIINTNINAAQSIQRAEVQLMEECHELELIKINEPIKISAPSKHQDWMTFLNLINANVQDVILKSLFNNAEVVEVNEQFVKIQLQTSSKFFHEKLHNSKDKWIQVFKSAFPSVELIIG